MAIPEFPAAIHRSHIVERLNTISNFKVALVSAPPGYGKTIAVAQFASGSNLPVIWLSLTQEERDLSILLAKSITAVDESASKPQSPPQHLDQLSPVDAAYTLTKHLSETFSQPFIYVLDNVEVILDSRSGEDWLRALVELMPSRSRLIIISRILPNLPFVEMVARHEILTIGQEDLRFLQSEIETLKRIYRAEADTSPEQGLYETDLEGWPAGVILALQPLPEEFSQVIGKSDDGPISLFTSLAKQMLKSQLPDLRYFLLTSSTLSELTPELCEKVLGIENSLQWISLVQKQNLFLSRQGGHFIYHSLFREFLQQTLRRVDPARFNQLHTRAAEWYQTNNKFEWSFFHYTESEQYDKASNLAEQVAFSFFQSGRLETLLAWYKRLLNTDAINPQLALACSMIYTDRYETTNAQDALQIANKNLDPGEHVYLWARSQLQLAQVYQQEGRYKEVIRLADRFKDHEIGLIRGRSHRIKGLANIRLGKVAEALADYEAALPLYRESRDPQALSQLLQDFHFILSRLGRLEEAGEYLQEVVALRRATGSKSALAIALNNLGTQYHDLSDYSNAEQTFLEGLQLISTVPHRWPELYLSWSLGNYYRDIGAFERADHFYQRAFRTAYEVDNPAIRCGLLINLSIMRRWQGLADQALIIASEAVELAQLHGLALEQITASIAQWGASADTGSPHDALKHLQKLEDSLAAQQAPLEMMRFKALCACVFLCLDDESNARNSLKEAVEIAEEVGTAQRIATMIVHSPYLNNWVELPRIVSPLLDKDLHSLKQSLNVKSVSQFSLYDDETFTLRVYCLGNEQVERNGSPIPLSEWRSSTARELFFYLVFHGAVARPDLSVIFWPDFDDKQVRDHFHTSLYRARKALGESVIIFQDDRYQINPSVALWCDALEFEAYIEQARLLPPREARTEDLWYRALKLYKGPFLNSIDQEWAFIIRERIEMAYIDALKGYGDCAFHRGDYRLAEEYFQKALQQEPYREDLHRSMLNSIYNRGAAKQLVDYYERTDRHFKSELGFGLSAQTRSFYKNLLA